MAPLYYYDNITYEDTECIIDPRSRGVLDREHNQQRRKHVESSCHCHACNNEKHNQNCVWCIIILTIARPPIYMDITHSSVNVVVLDVHTMPCFLLVIRCNTNYEHSRKTKNMDHFLLSMTGNNCILPVTYQRHVGRTGTPWPAA